MNQENLQRIIRQIQSIETVEDLEIFSLVLTNAVKDKLQKIEKKNNPGKLAYR